MHKPHELVCNQKMVGGSMNGSLKVVQAIVLLSFVGLFFTSCGGNQTALSSNTTSGTTTVNPTPTASGEPSIEEAEENATIPAGYDAGNIFVTVPDTFDDTNFSSIAGAYSQKCSFTSSSLVNDLTCVVEIGELSLFFNGIKFQYNVPVNQCKYIETEPYWFYNYEVGTGPTDVVVNVTKNASGTVTSSSCSVDGSTPMSCTTLTPPVTWNDIEFDFAEEVSVKCKYDTSDEDGGQNCCLGKYRLRTSTTTPDGTTSTDERGKSWGGSVAACIGGAGRTSWEKYDANGYPASLLEKMTPDKKRTKLYYVNNVSKSVNGAQHNFVVANYFTTGLHTHTGYGAASATASVNPYFISPVSDRSGTLVRSGNPDYLFDCLDEAFETNYRIRMKVQEWDTVAALQNYMSTGVSFPVGADEPGIAPGDCPGLAGDACNQAADLDDFVLINDNIPWQSFDTTFPASRTNYFPKSSY